MEPLALQPADYEAYLVLLDDAEGQRIAASLSAGWFKRAQALLAAFEPQADGAWCSFASTVIALRALGAPHVPTQRVLYDDFVRALGGMRGGVSLSELHTFLGQASATYCGSRLSVELQPAHERQRVLDELFGALLLGEADGSVVLINFARQLAGQWTGHWSVLGGVAIDERSVAYALVLDVAAHKVGVHWVPLEMIAACLCTRNVRDEVRGWLRVSMSAPEAGAAVRAAHGAATAGSATTAEARPPAARPSEESARDGRGAADAEPECTMI